MRRALELAERGWGRVSPNPMVGAVVVRDGEVVGEGWHTEYGKPHAEVEALRSAGERARGATMYVTLEPCSHHGKTPPCTEAVIAAGVSRLVFAAGDPNPRAGGGAARLREAGVTVEQGVEETAARSLNAVFFHTHSAAGEQRPFLELKLALSLDARIADAHGRSAWITGPEARTEVHRLRAGFDAVAVGIGTALADDPLLTVRGPVEPRIPPVRVVFDRRLRLPPTSRLVTTVEQAPLLVVYGGEADVHAAAALTGRGVRLVPAASLADGLAALSAVGIGSVFCEGGAELASALLRDSLVDRLTLFYAPVLLGPEGRSPFAGIPSARIEEVRRWSTRRRALFGPDTLITAGR
jgi:diaminohydroxyphosphoribosylaminopyrimidine deaminase / 5-amino-6-(5-phosphoribosylamino)uracil reductase